MAVVVMTVSFSVDSPSSCSSSSCREIRDRALHKVRGDRSKREEQLLPIASGKNLNSFGREVVGNFLNILQFPNLSLQCMVKGG